MFSVTRLMCCGLREISGLSYYKDTEEGFNDVLKSAIRDGVLIGSMDNPNVAVRCGALIFTQANFRRKYGVTFAERVRKLELGEVAEIPKFINPNTRHSIKTFIWLLDKKALIAYCKKHNLFAQLYAVRPGSVPPQAAPPQVIR